MDSMDSKYSGQKALTGEGAANHEPMCKCSLRSSALCAPSGFRAALTLSKPIESAIRNAEDHIEGGVQIILHANIVTGRELKRALDTMFPGPQEYFVQLRRDRYRVTLPKHNKADIERYVSTR